MTKLPVLISVCVVSAACWTQLAVALEEQRMGGAAPAGVAAARDPAAAVRNETPEKEADGGTEIRIPGLGRLGTLPKMDFGLDLLYGANGETVEQDVKTPGAVNDDLTIRGSVKHRF